MSLFKSGFNECSEGSGDCDLDSDCTGPLASVCIYEHLAFSVCIICIWEQAFCICIFEQALSRYLVYKHIYAAWDLWQVYAI